MKKHLKILIVSLLYNCEITKQHFDHKKRKNRWTFKLYPRKIPMMMFFVVLLPFIILKDGISGVKESWKDSVKIQSWSSFEIWSLEEPKKSQCYALL